MTDEIDYKELLRKYITHVGYSEGVTFLKYRDERLFSEDEWSVLQELDDGE